MKNVFSKKVCLIGRTRFYTTVEEHYNLDGKIKEIFYDNLLKKMNLSKKEELNGKLRTKDLHFIDELHVNGVKKKKFLKN